MAKPYAPYEGPIISREGHLSQRMVSNGGCATCLAIHNEKWQKANPAKMKAAIAAWEDANRAHKNAKGRAYSKSHQAETAAAKRRRRAEKLAAKLAARVPDPSDYTGQIVSRDDAKAAGEPRYFTGKPCKHGHVADRYVDGHCVVCAAERENWPKVVASRHSRPEAHESFLLNRRKIAAQDRAKHPEKHKARITLNAAIKSGQLTRPAICPACNKNPGAAVNGRTLIHAHHDDYSKPLEVRWLCSQCHSKEHR